MDNIKKQLFPISTKNKFILASILSITFYIFLSLKYLLGDEEQLTGPLSWPFFLLTVLSLLGLLMIYIKTYKLLASNKISLKLILATAIIFNLILLFSTFPKQSWDVYSYISRSRIHSVYHDNSYLSSYNNYPDDILYPVLVNKWSGNTNIYGPLFVLIGWLFSFLTGDNLFYNVLIFKLFFIGLNIANIFIIKKISNSKGAVFLYAWNPFLIYEFALKAHLDIIQITFILLALLFAKKSDDLFYSIKSWVMLFLSIFIKYISIVLLPILFIIITRNLQTIKQKILFFLAALLSGSIISLVLFYPFWQGSAIFDRLIFLAASYKNPILVSPLVIFFSLFFQLFKIANPLTAAAITSRIIFFIAYAFLCSFLLFSRKKSYNITKYLIIGIGLFLAAYFTWFLPWYMTTLIALLAVFYGEKQKNMPRFLIYGLSFYGILFYLILR